jgi:protein-tyrosine phosphatase
VPEPFRILFVCWGNICRSPTAEGLLRRDVEAAGLADRVVIDSVGTSSEHQGSRPDRRAMAEARRHGVDLGGLRARRISDADWAGADLILVADDTVERQLLRLAPAWADRSKLARITSYLDPAGPFAADAARGDVPDPYYGGRDGFAHVFALLEEASAGILAAAAEAVARSA